MNRSHGSYVSDFAVLVVWIFDPILLLVDRLVNADMVVRGMIVWVYYKGFVGAPHANMTVQIFQR